MKLIRKTITLIAMAAWAASTVASAAGKPLKIYILVGQSNMQGTARLSTFPHMTLDPVTKPLHDKLVDEKGQPRVHEDIYITAVSQGGGWGGTDDTAKDGQLTVGFGGSLESDEVFGPELAFGVTMREQVGQPILLIKTAWGGKSLYTQFRPPSAGNRPVPANLEERWKKDGKYEEELAKYHEAPGHYYRLMMAHVQKVLADPGKYHPAYDKDAGYEVAGFAWFQGFNDQFEPYPKSDPKDKKSPTDYSEYSRLLAHFIRDVRTAFKAPAMPFVIGVIGIGGKPDEKNPLREAMAAPAELPEFKGNVMAVHTANYWDDALVEAAGKVAKLWHMKNNAYTLTREGEIDPGSVAAPGWESVGDPLPEERVWRYVTFNIDEDKQYRDLREGEEGDVRFFNEDMPAKYTEWLSPDCDDSTWQSGPAPIGKGAVVKIPENHTKWGDGNMLLMRTRFELNPADYEAFRVVIMANQSYNVYLNGHKVATYVWWKKGASYRAFELTKEQTAYLKNGTNVLAVQANISPKDSAANWVNAMLEGMSTDDYAKLIKLYDSVCTPKDIETAKGKSNQAYHYLGSAKIYSQIGEAFADALIELKRK